MVSTTKSVETNSLLHKRDLVIDQVGRMVAGRVGLGKATMVSSLEHCFELCENAGNREERKVGLDEAPAVGSIGDCLELFDIL